MYLDADTHVDENEETWSYLSEQDQHLAPRTISFQPDELPPWLARGGATKSGSSRFWFIDGQLFPRRIRNDEETGTTVGTRELFDIPLRLRHMDELDVELQVIYPTVFISEVTRRPEYESVLARSYNRWLAERCADTGGRLRWVAVIPFASSAAEAIEEIRFAKENGAVGLYKRAIDGRRAASDAVFFPAYKEAEELDLPICIHQSNAWEPIVRGLSPVRLGTFDAMEVPRAFVALVSQRVPARFPRLRFGFIESASSWLPYCLDLAGATGRGESLADLNCFVANFEYEDIPYLVAQAGGDDNFLVGSDYCHSDASAVKDIHARVARRDDLDEKTVVKITNDNVRRFYGL